MFSSTGSPTADKHGRTGNRRRQLPISRLTVTVAALAALGTGLAACGSSSSGSSGSSGSSSKATLVVADLAPFTGPDAALGPTYLASCLGATTAINNAGGVLGHKLTCKQVDTRGDPADAVPATKQMFATTSNLVLVIGCTSDEAAAVVPICPPSAGPATAWSARSSLPASSGTSR